jgi:hypothetical protein
MPLQIDNSLRFGLLPSSPIVLSNGSYPPCKRLEKVGKWTRVITYLFYLSGGPMKNRLGQGTPIFLPHVGLSGRVLFVAEDGLVYVRLENGKTVKVPLTQIKDPHEKA